MLNELDGRTIRDKMIHFIKKYYADTLGDDLRLLDEPNGLDKLHRKYCI